MNFKYKLFAYIFNFFKFFSSNKTFITFIIDEISFNYPLKYLKEELNKKKHFKYNYIYKNKYSFDKSKNLREKFLTFFNLLNFFFIKTFRLSKSKYIFLDDNFSPLAYMNFDKHTKVIQLWHAPGAFKKFGYTAVDNENQKNLIEQAGHKIDYIVVSSKNVSKIYEEAFKVENNKILALGTPKTDYYFDKKNNSKENIKKIRAEFDKKYAGIKGKKIVLYAPTFRENKEKNNDILVNFDFNLFNSYLGDEFCLFFKSHPKFKISKEDDFINVSDYKNTDELLLISDILITDYSSIMIEYAILFKPIIFYPFDLDYYISNERGFYFDYNDVPGEIAKNTEEIIELIKNKKNNSIFDMNKIHTFLNLEYDYLDDKSSKRIIDFLLNE